MMVAAYVLLHIKWLAAGAEHDGGRDAMTGRWTSLVGNHCNTSIYTCRDEIEVTRSEERKKWFIARNSCEYTARATR